MNFLSYKGLKQQNICTTFDFRSKIFGLFCTYFDFCFVLCSLIDFCFVLCSLIRTFANDHRYIPQRRAGVTFVGKL